MLAKGFGFYGTRTTQFWKRFVLLALPKCWKKRGKYPKSANRILGRAYFDWHHWLELLTSCRLSVPLQKLLETEVMTEFAPAFFVESVRKQALYDSMRVLIQRDAIREIAEVMRESKVRGVLLNHTTRGKSWGNRSFTKRCVSTRNRQSELGRLGYADGALLPA